MFTLEFANALLDQPNVVVTFTYPAWAEAKGMSYIGYVRRCIAVNKQGGLYKYVGYNKIF